MNFKQNSTQKKEAQIEEYIFDLSIHIWHPDRLSILWYKMA